MIIQRFFRNIIIILIIVIILFKVIGVIKNLNYTKLEELKENSFANNSYINILDKSGFFEVTTISKDDLKKSEMYKENAKRNEMLSSCANYDDYLKSLKMKATIKPFEPIYMARIAQLTNKSNQFNLTTHRYTQAEIEEIANDEKYIKSLKNQHLLLTWSVFLL